MKHRKLLLVLFCAIHFTCTPKLQLVITASNVGNTIDEFAQAFYTPQDTLKPWVYYHWISDNVSADGITRDLEAMAEVGIGEALIANIGLEDVAYGKVRMLSEEWWQLNEHVIREGKRLGVNIGFFNCPGWSQSGGPWVKPGEAMRYLTSSEMTIDGGKRISQLIPAPKDTFQDVRVIAFPSPKEDHTSITNAQPTITASVSTQSIESLIDGNHRTICTFPSTDSIVTVDIAVPDAFTARSLIVIPAPKPLSANIELKAEQNGLFKTVANFSYDRSNPDINVGPVPQSPVVIAVPKVTSKKFRLIFRNIKDRAGRKTNGAFADIIITPSPKLERFAEKKLDKMFPTPLPLWQEFQWANQMETGDASMKVQPDQIIDLTNHLSTQGVLNWDAPAGKWTIMRIGVTPTGTMNSPSAPNATGLEVDKMNKKYLQNHFDAYLGRLLKRMPAEDRTAWKHVVIDSYEMGPQNWTEGLAEDFTTRYGYEFTKWLPVLSGRIVSSADESNRFLWDLRRLVADRVAYDYVGGLREISDRHGLKIWLENYGHWGFPSEFLMYGGQSHEIAGEFWNEGELGNIECRAASSAGHIYGHSKVFAESYTSAGNAYERYPALLKKRGDWSFTEGINAVLLHLYIHQPYEEKTPGINAWYGTEFNRKNTWFEQSKSWIDYQRRCMYMLQRGHVVNDVAYFIGEDAPKMTGVRDPEIPKGYSYDYINAEVIIQRASVKDGRLVLPDGMTYRILVLPKLETMRPELLQSIQRLVNDGATILGYPPKRSPSLENYRRADKDVQQMSKELWGSADGINIKKSKYGKGTVLCGMDMQTALNEINVLPDVNIPDSKKVLWIHRREDEKEIYFITNQTDTAIDFNASFRVVGKQPELFDAIDGSHRLLKEFTQQQNTTTVPLHLEAAQSFFVVFRNSTNEKTGRGINFPQSHVIQTIATPWQVTFEEAQRGPKEPVTFNYLTDWSKHSNDNIKYYSGSAVYTNYITVTEQAPGQTLILDLGEVKNMAVVSANGIEAGAVWSAPYKVDVTKLLKKGNNKIEIKVVSTWANRLIGDSKLPESHRKTWLSVNTFKPEQPLVPSGLLGPVRLLAMKYE